MLRRYVKYLAVLAVMNYAMFLWMFSGFGEKAYAVALLGSIMSTPSVLITAGVLTLLFSKD